MATTAAAALADALKTAVVASLGVGPAERPVFIACHLIAQIDGSNASRTAAQPPWSPGDAAGRREQLAALEETLTAAVNAAHKTTGDSAVPSARAVAERLLLSQATSMLKGCGKLHLEIHCALTQLDDRLVLALARGDIRLLRSASLRTQSDESRLLKRQDLEALGAGGVLPLLSPAEAVELLRKGTRGVGVASHGWLTPGNPDPAGVRLKLLRQELNERPYIEAIFFDFASLYQQPRDQKQNEAFQRAIGACQTPLDDSPCLGLSTV
jgi:hypothetical protein